jgi:alcohol dehydrogenase class IV
MRGAFTYTANPSRVLFGPGRLADLPAELSRLGVSRPLIITGPTQTHLAGRVIQLIPAAATFTGAAMHTPTHVTLAALDHLRAVQADALVALGGGSAIGLAKALALRTGRPQIAIPTSYAGSEMTAILGETDAGRKTTKSSPRLLPGTVIYDVDLTLSLPPHLSAVSGLNAIAHAVEALYARDTNPVIGMMAEEAIAALARSLPRIVANPASRAARSDAQYGAWLAATCLGAVGMALHHKICHVLGGSFQLPHAQTHAVILPHATAYNAAAAPDAMGSIARALGAAPAAPALFALARLLAAPAALRDLGMPEAAIDPAIDQVMQQQYWNPRPLDPAALRAMLRRAWAGEPPMTA